MLKVFLPTSFTLQITKKYVTVYIYAKQKRRDRTFTKEAGNTKNMKTYRAIVAPQPTALVIRCGDPRFRIAFLAFISDELGLKQGEFVPITVAGGPAALAHAETRAIDHSFIMKQIGFFLTHFKSIREVIIFGHQDCGYYRTIDFGPTVIDREKNDLPKAGRAINEWADAFFRDKDIKILSYYASFDDESKTGIVFETVSYT